MANAPFEGTCSFFLLLLFCVLLPLPAWGEATDSLQEIPFAEETSGAVDQLVGKFSDEPEMPERPRRSASFTKEFTNSSSFSVGLKIQALGSKIGATVDTAFVLNWRENLLLVRHSPNGESAIMKDRDGSISLNWGNHPQFIALCSYKASARGSLKLVGTTNFFGSGLENIHDMENSLSIEQGSKYFRVGPEDSIFSLQDKCFSHFKSQVEASVVQDLKDLIQANVFYLPHPHYSDEQNAVQSALEGPPHKVFHIKNRQLRVELVRHYINKRGLLVIKGMVYEVLSLWPDNQVSYSLYYKEGVLVESHYEIDTIFGKRADASLIADVKYFAELVGAETMLLYAPAHE